MKKMDAELYCEVLLEVKIRNEKYEIKFLQMCLKFSCFLSRDRASPETKAT